MGPAELFSLEGKVVVLTGASAGLGVQFAQTLAAAGARQVLAARRADRLDDLVARLEANGAEALAVPCDVKVEADVDRLVAATLERFGRVDVLVNNAGITEVIAAEDDPIESFQHVVDVNLRGVFLCAQRIGRAMLEARSGVMVNVASVLGLVGTGQIPQAAYAASKGGVVNLTRELAAQWARRGIRVNALAPGWFESEMTVDMFGDASSERWMERNTPMGRAGQAGELAGALLFLCSGASSFVTGQTIAVDGGWTCV